MGKHIVSMMLAALIGLGPSIQELKSQDPGQLAFSNRSISGFSYGKVPKAVKEKATGISYRPNPYISFQDLRYVKVKYYGYDGKIKNGQLLVHKSIAKDIVEIFQELFTMQYPIESIQLIDDFGADDTKSMEANNTSAFNYRIVAGTSHLSKHAYGKAIDINPRVNPFVKRDSITPENGKIYAQRDVKKCRGKYKYNMIHRNDRVYRLFRKHGFQWGGDWITYKDYQHFEKR
ncbi:M15 family metallopeptidase [Anaerostipes sp.]|uniref:M15 family metallopeptidase n=1 Tax=Anaerostipes sp. TaxID=1872530 RepID=UPI0025BC136B|nr:M15 family metallopeptidase [Anaerostipes sp.]MBS7009765.1 M15 family metallopeptidase [Anaerostipes sp.]